MQQAIWLHASSGYSFQRFFAAFLAISDRRLALMPSARALPPMRPSATAAAFLPSSVVRSSISPGGDPHDMDRVADYIGGALLAFRASGHSLTSSNKTERRIEGPRSR